VVLGLVLGALALGPGLRRGFVLRYDMVFVPSPPWSMSALGLAEGAPRGFPSDAVVTALASVLPADLVQKAILLGIFVLGAAGAARLLPEAPLVARLAAGAVYVWNPYVAERLLIGQWALLLGYAGLPWAVRAVAEIGRGRGGFGRRSGGGGVWGDAWRVGVALVPGAVGGFAPMTVVAPVVVGVALARRTGRVRAVGIAAGAWVVLALPWAVPGVLARVTTDPAGVDVFAARADTPFGAAGSLLALGGVWNREVVPSGYGRGAVAWVWLAFVVLGIVAYGVAAWRGRGSGAGWMWGLGAGAVAGYGIAVFGVTGVGRGVLRGLVGAVPAFGVVRDGQRFVAPVALVAAVGIGLAARWVVRACARREAAGSGVLAAGVAVVAPVMLLPTLAYGAAGRIEAVWYPPDWLRARAVMAADPAPGAVLVLPWTAYRGFAWNGGRTVLDPATAFFGRRVIWNDGLRVDGRALAPEDPAARAVDAALARPGPGVGVRVRYVVVEGGKNENVFQVRLAGFRRVYRGTDISVYRLVTSR
jgi:hypothetical protein